MNFQYQSWDSVLLYVDMMFISQKSSLYLMVAILKNSVVPNDSLQKTKKPRIDRYSGWGKENEAWSYKKPEIIELWKVNINVKKQKLKSGEERKNALSLY